MNAQLPTDVDMETILNYVEALHVLKQLGYDKGDSSDNFSDHQGRIKMLVLVCKWLIFPKCLTFLT